MSIATKTTQRLARRRIHEGGREVTYELDERRARDICPLRHECIYELNKKNRSPKLRCDKNNCVSFRIVSRLRKSDDDADLVMVPRDRTDEQILDALYRSLPHPEQTRMHMENQNARDNTIDDLRSFLVEILKASPYAPKTPPPGEG